VSSTFLHEWVLAHAEHTPDAPAIASPAVRLSYGLLAERVRALAGHLALAGIGPGDRVLVSLPNSPAAVVAALAVHRRGATSVEVSYQWSPAVLGDAITRSRARGAFMSGRDARTSVANTGRTWPGWRRAVTRPRPTSARRRRGSSSGRSESPEFGARDQ
jgi:long-chain acyl-CoA synthetase